jgi:CBS domain containing-hemolysin-like protein
MSYIILILLFIVSNLFYILDASFRSFSRISLAGFLNDINRDHIKNFDFVKHYEPLKNSLRAFSFFWQLSLFLYAYLFLKSRIPEFGTLLTLLVLVTGFLLLFNGLLYSLAYRNKEKILRLIIPLYYLPWIFFFPVTRLHMALEPKEATKNGESDDISDEELEVFFEESAKEGVLETEDKEMIESVLEFGDTLVKEIMTPRVDMIYVTINTGLMDLINKIIQNKKSRYPVVKDRIDNIEGIILSKDVFNYWNKNDFHIKKILRQPFFVPETMRIFELLKELQKEKQKFAIVVDEFGGISGVVTMEDIIEEIVGEIQDEYDDDSPQIIKEKDFYIVKGNTDISEVADVLGLEIQEEEDYQTIAGLISFKLGKIPKRHDKISIDPYLFEVLETEKNRIRKVKIAHAPDKD